MSQVPIGVHELYDNTFNEMANNEYDLPIFVDLWAEWCIPCRKVAPIVKELEEKYRGRMLFTKLDIDHNPDTQKNFRVASIPMFLILYKGKLVDSFIGAQGKDKFEKKINEALERINK